MAINRNNFLITGSSGFVGTNLKNFLQLNEFVNLLEISRDILQDKSKLENFLLENGDSGTLVHLAGKAHDLNKLNDPSEYYYVNTELTKNLLESFLRSSMSTLIFLSSTKAAADSPHSVLTELYVSNPLTHYGKSKKQAEDYILSKQLPTGKRVFILRPCMIHGQNNKGNLNLLYSIVSKGLPWPLGAFNNIRSFCSVENLCFVITELAKNIDIPSGIYNVSDDDPLSTNELIALISQSLGTKSHIINIPKWIVIAIAFMGDILPIPLNTERLKKLTENYVVDNTKIKEALGKPLPVSAKVGLLKTFESFKLYGQ